MKVVILAGGLGTRISEESHLRPKPMIEIGEQPILWHIMKIYGHYGFTDFVICCGYKSYVIKEYFSHYYMHTSDLTLDFRENNRMVIHRNSVEPWRVTLVDTGLNTQTGGRLRRVREHIGDERFMLTYGDGVADVDLRALLGHHERSGAKATITAVQPGGRYGVLDLEGERVLRFAEKAQEDGGWINGGFMVFEPEIFGYLGGDECVLERDALEAVARDGGMGAYKHEGFWQCMDMLRDKERLEELWRRQEAPWKLWN